MLGIYETLGLHTPWLHLLATLVLHVTLASLVSVTPLGLQVLD